MTYLYTMGKHWTFIHIFFSYIGLNLHIYTYCVISSGKQGWFRMFRLLMASTSQKCFGSTPASGKNLSQGNAYRAPERPDFSSYVKTPASAPEPDRMQCEPGVSPTVAWLAPAAHDSRNNAAGSDDGWKDVCSTLQIMKLSSVLKWMNGWI